MKSPLNCHGGGLARRTYKEPNKTILPFSLKHSPSLWADSLSLQEMTSTPDNHWSPDNHLVALPHLPIEIKPYPVVAQSLRPLWPFLMPINRERDFTTEARLEGYYSRPSKPWISPIRGVVEASEDLQTLSVWVCCIFRQPICNTSYSNTIILLHKSPE